MSDVLIDPAGFANAIASAVVQFLGAQQPAVSVASPIQDMPAPAPAPAVNPWTADTIVRWVDSFGRGRNSHGIPDVAGMTDPAGLLPFYALDPGHPVFTAEYPKSAKARAKHPDARLFTPATPAPTPAPSAPAEAPTVDAAVVTAALRRWVTRNPEHAGQLSSILAAGMAARVGTYRDMLAMGGIVPERAVKK